MAVLSKLYLVTTSSWKDRIGGVLVDRNLDHWLPVNRDQSSPSLSMPFVVRVHRLEELGHAFDSTVQLLLFPGLVMAEIDLDWLLVGRSARDSFPLAVVPVVLKEREKVFAVLTANCGAPE